MTQRQRAIYLAHLLGIGLLAAETLLVMAERSAIIRRTAQGAR